MRAGFAVVVCGLLALVGCGGGAPVVSSVAPPIAPLSDVALTGVVSSGAQPIVGAHVYLLAANTTGYGGNGIAASSGNASVSLMAAQETGTADSVGAYVTTDANGKFSLTGDYACSSGQQLYLYALGGNAGSGVNSAAGLMAAVGGCPSSSGPAVFATVNDVSTIAAAYAFAGFATDATHVGSSGTALAQVGAANAFANAANLETLGTGAALATTPAGNGTVPQAEINTLADVLASCVNSSGAGSSACSTLFSNAVSGGTGGSVAGSMVNDTATAAINIAHSPGSNVASLFGLAGSVFMPKLSAQPNDLNLAIIFSGAAIATPTSVAIDGLGDVWIANMNGASSSITKLSSGGSILSGVDGYVGGGLYNPASVAIDRSGNAWVANSGDSGNPISSVTEISSSGAILSGTSGYTGGGIYGPSSPASIAIDGTGNVWVASFQSFGVTKLSNLGAILSEYGGFGGPPISIAIDGSGNAWVPKFGAGTVIELSNSGSILSGNSGYSTGGVGHLGGSDGGAIALDRSGDAWMANYEQPFISELSNTGSIISGTSGPIYGLSGGGLNESVGIAIDGSGNAWIANSGNGSVTEISNSGSFLSGASGYIASVSGKPLGIAIDGSGNAWITVWTNNSVVELIGAATPVITPIAAGLPATPTVDGTSNLGTRP